MALTRGKAEGDVSLVKQEKREKNDESTGTFDPEDDSEEGKRE